ncbi:hypothetical protein KVG88_30025 [Pseudomonas sp. SWRI74]|jgi:hypothetical protein|uniref:Uncharacterized protein n=1 Tax=Pseudomonas azerbaijanoccidentalis TaxID=2842347 RepID=A0ABS6QZI0_9PSED|nr:hypothetical protein [Pseudomonas azerbaijanoccidentalis]MBV4524313.1 hypothetical protein [Pseudomonas azerbaijanoccidentalis]
MKISALVAQYVAVLPIGCILTEQQIERHLLSATRFYYGCADLASGEPVGADALIATNAAQDVDLSESELTLIRPLWDLYMEKENSMALEASRTQGAELFGRAVAEVQMSIQDYELRLPQMAFCEEWVTI